MSSTRSFLAAAPVAALAATPVAVLLLSGCLSLDTGPGLQMRQSIAAEGEALPESARASGGSGTATVSGTIVGRLPCDRLDGSIRESGSTIRVTIKVRADVGACNGIAPTSWNYIANILGLDGGTRDMVVEHQFVGRDPSPKVVLDTVITIG